MTSPWKRSTDSRYRYSWGPAHWQNPADDDLELTPALRLYSVRQVARILQITEQVVRNLIHDGKLPAWRVGIFLRVPQGALERFLEENPSRGPDERRRSRRRPGEEAAPVTTA